jgi:hypothetical protein
MTDSIPGKVVNDGVPAEPDAPEKVQSEALAMPPPPASLTRKSVAPGRKPLFGS